LGFDFSTVWAAFAVVAPNENAGVIAVDEEEELIPNGDGVAVVVVAVVVAVEVVGAGVANVNDKAGILAGTAAATVTALDSAFSVVSHEE
jgi:hypothetical protein